MNAESSNQTGNSGALHKSAVVGSHEMPLQGYAEYRAVTPAFDTNHACPRLMRLIENLPSALFEYHEDPEGRITFPFFSPRLCELLGVDAEAIAQDGSAAFAHVHPDDLPELLSAIDKSKANLTPFHMRYRIAHASLGERWMLAFTQPVREPDGGTLWHGSLSDITEQEAIKHQALQASKELCLAHSRLTNIANIAPAGLFEAHVQPDGSFALNYFSDRYAELLGQKPSAIRADPKLILASIHDDDRSAVLETIRIGFATNRPWSVRFRTLAGATWLAAQGMTRPDADGSMIFVAAVMDVTEHATREMHLEALREAADLMKREKEHQALHDGLTGLPNRRFYDSVFATRVAAAKEGEDCTLVRIDLDHFKHVNDTLGHEAGDSVLIRVADILSRSIRPGDFAARLGGDEFSILMHPGAGEGEAQRLIDRIRVELAVPHLHDGKMCRFGASFGVACVEDLASTGHDLSMFADAALYEAKSKGRNRVEAFTACMREQYHLDRQLAVEIQEGLERDEFIPYFQPQVTAADGQLAGAEVLLRWQHPTRGLLAPSSFMHVAEQLRLIPDLDRVMMERSHSVLLELARDGIILPKLSFNLSAGSLLDPGLADLARSLAKGPTLIAFELLESILIEDETDMSRYQLETLKAAGIEIEIDDFGSGHASVISLMQIRPTTLKIDQRLIAPIANDACAEALVRAILTMARSLGIKTLAEGVETECQADKLREMGCDLFQGFLYSRPVEKSMLLTFARKLHLAGCEADKPAPFRRDAA